MPDEKISYFPSPSLNPPSDLTVPQNEALTIHPMRPASFVFNGNNNKMMLTIHPDGTIERGPAFTTTDEMSLEFWRKVNEAFPQFLDTIKR